MSEPLEEGRIPFLELAPSDPAPQHQPLPQQYPDDTEQAMTATTMGVPLSLRSPPDD